MNLPVEVVEATRNQKCSVIIGSRATLEAALEQDRRYPDERAIAKALGGKILPRDACAALEAKVGRAAMVRQVQALIGAADVPPYAAHKLALSRFSRLFTSAMDDLLERTAQEMGLAYEVRYRGEAIPEPDPAKKLIYKLRGGFERPETLVLTEADFKAKPFGDLAKDVRKLLRRDIAFFLGYRPDEQEFDHIFEDFSDAFGGELPRCHLAVAQGKISDYHWQKWVWRGLLLFTADPLEALTSLEEQVDAR